MSNGQNLEPQHPSGNFWLAYLHWTNSVHRWEGYLDERDNADARKNEILWQVANELMLDEVTCSQFWEQVTLSYWELWRN